MIFFVQKYRKRHTQVYMKKYTTAERRGLGEAFFCPPMAIVSLYLYDSDNCLYERRNRKEIEN